MSDVYRYALAVLRDPADAEDVTQTTFLNAYRAFERGERPERPLNWFIAIAHNVCRQRFRQATRRPREVALDFDVADELVGEDDEAPRASDIRRALSQLAFNQRAALVLREVEGRSCAEIGETLGLSTSAVEALLFRARRAMREQLEGTLTCSEAERAVSRQLDGGLSRKERGALRAHLRACPECATLARRMRAQRSLLRGLLAVPLPGSLATFSATGTGTGVGWLGAGAALKAAALATAAVAVGAGGLVVAKHAPWHTGPRTSRAAHVRQLHPRSVEPSPARRVTPTRHAPVASQRALDRNVPQPKRTHRPVKVDATAEPPGNGARPGAVGHASHNPRTAGPAQPTHARHARPVAVAPSARAPAPAPSPKSSVLRSSSSQTASACRAAQLSDPATFASTYGPGARGYRRCLLDGVAVVRHGGGTGAAKKR